MLKLYLLVKAEILGQILEQSWKSLEPGAALRVPPSFIFVERFVAVLLKETTALHDRMQAASDVIPDTSKGFPGKPVATNQQPKSGVNQQPMIGSWVPVSVSHNVGMNGLGVAGNAYKHLVLA